MAQKMSTGLCNKLLNKSTGSPAGAGFADIFNLGFIKIYDGTPPATADAALSGNTLLVTISVSGGGTGITFEASASSGVLLKKSTETWQGTNAATGTATFYRLVAVGDDGTSSTTQPRIQGTVGTGGADMNLGSTSLTASATTTINYFSQALVPS